MNPQDAIIRRIERSGKNAAELMASEDFRLEFARQTPPAQCQILDAMKRKTKWTRQLS